MIARLRNLFPLRQPRRAAERRGIHAGAGGRRWDGFTGLSDPAKDMRTAREPARQRAAALAANDPLGARAVDAWVASLVGGGGWQARSRHSDEATRRRLNEDFEALTGPLLAPAARAIVRDGEALLHLRVAGAGLTPRLIPAQQLDASLTREAGSGRRIEAGIELDDDDELVAYHILRPAPGGGLSLEAERIDDQVAHRGERTVGQGQQAV